MRARSTRPRSIPRFFGSFSNVGCRAEALTSRPPVPSSPLLSTQVSLPPLGDEPTATDADDARFDVRRERQVLEEEALRDAGASPSRHDADGAPTSSGDPDGDPTSLDNTIRRITSAPEDPAVEKFLRMGYARDAVVLALAMWGDAEAKIVDFLRRVRAHARARIRPRDGRGRARELRQQGRGRHKLVFAMTRPREKVGSGRPGRPSAVVSRRFRT